MSWNGWKRKILAGAIGGGAQYYNATVNPKPADPQERDDLYFGTTNNAIRFNPSQTPVRQKFEGYVNFHFNSEVDISSLNNNDTRNTLSSLCRAAEVPTAEIQTDIKNQYNRKRVTVTHTEFKPITVTAYDTVDSAWVIVLMKMYAHLFTQPIGKFDTSGNTPLPAPVPNDIVPDAVAGGGSEAVHSGNFNSNYAGYNLRPAAQRNFITSMDIVKYHGQKAIRYTVFNPMITNFEIEGIDHGDSMPAMITMSISYENFTINPVVNDWLSEEELQRFSGFNVGVWNYLRNGQQNEPNPMGADMPGRSIADNPVMGAKKMDFLNLAPDATRSPQANEFFKNFGPSESKEDPNKDEKKKPDNGVDNQRQKLGGSI